MSKTEKPAFASDLTLLWRPPWIYLIPALIWMYSQFPAVLLQLMYLWENILSAARLAFAVDTWKHKHVLDHCIFFLFICANLLDQQLCKLGKYSGLVQQNILLFQYILCYQHCTVMYQKLQHLSCDCVHFSCGPSVFSLSITKTTFVTELGRIWQSCFQQCVHNHQRKKRRNTFKSFTVSRTHCYKLSILHIAFCQLCR